MKIRIGKFLTNAGYCSRRDAEKLVSLKKILINNQICEHPSQKVGKEDLVKVDNKVIYIKEKTRLWKLHKPIKYICSTKDHLKRKKIFDLLPKNLKNLISIGRLDYMSEGLILLTNNGDLSRHFELPSNKFERTYKVCLKGSIQHKSLIKINKGLIIGGIRYNKIKVNYYKKIGNFNWLIFKLKEGKNREIRNICSFFSWDIVKLIRVQYGPYKLGKMKVGEISEINIGENDKNYWR